MSEGYIEASVEDPKSGAKISVIQSPRKTTRIVQFDNWVEQEACSDFLAGIIVRGIRSLEEENRLNLSCADDNGYDWRDVLVDDPVEMLRVVERLMPGAG